MSGEETLRMFARIRGIPKNEIERVWGNFWTSHTHTLFIQIRISFCEPSPESKSLSSPRNNSREREQLAHHKKNWRTQRDKEANKQADRKSFQMIKGVVDAIGIQMYAKRQIKTYSGGNKRRLSLGMALVGENFQLR